MATSTRCYEGPGINDDGSGVSMMLETAEQMHELNSRPRNKVRFIFFSGEEQGLLGSDYYVSTLSERQIKDISVMLDYDMLASGNYGRFIYDGDGDEHGFAGPNGSGVIEQVFKDFWDSQGLAYETIPFDGRSDYDAFTAAGSRQAASSPVPRWSKTAGTGGAVRRHGRMAFDPCYHQLCDTLANISETGLCWSTRTPRCTRSRRSPRPRRRCRARPRGPLPRRSRGTGRADTGFAELRCAVSGRPCAGGPTRNTRRVASGDWLVVEQQPTQARSRASSIFRAAGGQNPRRREQWAPRWALPRRSVGRFNSPLARQVR